MSFDFIKKLYREWQNDNATMLAAAVAFYATFSIGPLLLMIVAIGSLFFSEEATRREVVEGTARLVNMRAAKAVERILTAATTGDKTTVTIFSGILLLFGASGIFRQLRLALNLVLDIPDPPEGWVAFLRSRAIAVVMVVGTMVLLVVVMTLTATLTAIRRFVPTIPAVDLTMWRIVDFCVSTLLIAVVFAAILKWVPDVRLRWRHVWKGAAVAAILFSIGRLLLGFYLSRAAATSIYGAAASLFVTLVMIFFAVLVILLAAEITELLGRRDAEFEAERKKAQDESAAQNLQQTEE
ncbi:MAG TPA: YihY/virulence factor BrkB family protein [Thermoanaerobaculia bacterium]|nr:YihY/virulence factor BrkB family protein [Thermoanaerobaculia bacterium]